MKDEWEMVLFLANSDLLRGGLTHLLSPRHTICFRVWILTISLKSLFSMKNIHKKIIQVSFTVRHEGKDRMLYRSINSYLNMFMVL